MTEIALTFSLTGGLMTSGAYLTVGDRIPTPLAALDFAPTGVESRDLFLRDAYRNDRYAG